MPFLPFNCLLRFIRRSTTAVDPRSNTEVVDHIVLIYGNSAPELPGFQRLRENCLESFAIGGDCLVEEKVSSNIER